MGEVGNIEKQLVLAGGRVVGPGIEIADFDIDRADLGFDDGGVRALRPELADLF